MKKHDKILDQIESLRKEKRFTQAKVAEVLAIDRTTYVRKANGKIPLTLKEFLIIADWLNTRPEYFFKTLLYKSKKN